MRLLLILAGVALAHSKLVRSEPADGASLDEAPAQVQLWFDAEVERRFHRFTLVGPDGATLPLDGYVPDAADRTRLGARLPELAPGRWQVTWDVVSRDGHRVDGRVTFEVAPPSKSPPEAE